MIVPTRLSAKRGSFPARFRSCAEPCKFALLAAALCGCMSLPETSDTMPDRSKLLAGAEAERSPAANSSREQLPETQFAAVENLAASTPRSSIRRTTADGASAAPAVEQGASRGATFTPAQPRVPLMSPGDGDGSSTSPERYPDEYLFDGGDRDLPIHYGEFNRRGLDTEDTIAEYTDHVGDRHVKPSNRVAVYAPRFAALRSISHTEAGTSVDRLASNFEAARTTGLKSRMAPTFHQENQTAGGIRMRSRVSGVDGHSGELGVDQIVRPTAHEKLLNLYQDLAFLRTGRFVQSDEARLAAGIQAALAWTRDQNPVVVAETSSSQEVYGSFRPQEYIGREDERKTKGRLRIVKLADKQSASPGDIITFTIRYDNLGDRELYHIRIVDNLTPRLVYVEDSATSDRAGRLVVEDNEEGSLVLRFEVDNPLPGHQGGVVTFQARVR